MNDHNDKIDAAGPIYNSRITKTYLNYLAANYPSIDCESLLEYAGMTLHGVEDPAHWFTQEQVDRFHNVIVEQTGNGEISREAGRYVSSSRGIGAVKQYLLGYLSPAFAYLAAGKVVGQFSRATVNTARKLSHNKIEITCTQLPGVHEKPYQCQNRIGNLEAMAEVFTGKFAEVYHPKCFHRGNNYCRYIVKWDNTTSRVWKRTRNYATIGLALLTLISLLFFTPGVALAEALLGLVVILLLTLIATQSEKRDLLKTVQTQKEAAQEHLDQLSIRYNHALLVQEIGQATSAVLDIEALIGAVMQIMAKRLDFDRGVIMLANRSKTRLVYINGYGYSEEHEEMLRNTRFHLDRQDSQGFFVRAFFDKKPLMLQNVLAKQSLLSQRSLNLAQQMGVKSLICVPIVYENESLGILAVDTVHSERLLTQSDMNLLQGVSSQTAVSIANARSFLKLQVSEEKYRTILESIDDSYFEVDLGGNLVFFNESTCRMLGYSRNELMGMNYRRIMDAVTAEKVFRTLNAVYRSGEATKALDWKMIRKDQSACFVQALISSIRNTEGLPIGFRGIARDITEGIQAEKERKILEARLQQAEKMKAIGTLAGGVAHDLNNVLSGLVSYPELLLMDLPADSPLRKPILTIQKSGERASAIVQDLLTLARRGVAVSEVININQIATEYLNSPEHEKILALNPEVEIQKELTSNLLNMIGSPVHLSKSLMNIVNNAAEAMPAGGRIRIITENRYVDRPIKGYDHIPTGDYTVLSVSDNGIGISDVDLERIFEPFYTKKVMGRSGSGLGMAVVWGCVKDHKGFIDVKSRPGEGTSFTLYFPATRKHLKQKAAPLALNKFKGHGESILIVDDIAEQREIASELLQKLGYTVATVPSGEAAVEYLKSKRVNLVVLDMIMEPGLDGLETYKQIIALRPSQKAIIASGFSETALVREAQSLGAGAYVKKPYMAEEIGLAVHLALKSSPDSAPRISPSAD
jgi:PAS domain S-box-containing protein